MRTSAALASMRTLIKCVHAVALSGWGHAKGVRGNLPPLRRPVLCCPMRVPCARAQVPATRARIAGCTFFSPRARSVITMSLAQGRDSSRSNRVEPSPLGPVQPACPRRRRPVRGARVHRLWRRAAALRMERHQPGRPIRGPRTQLELVVVLLLGARAGVLVRSKL